MPWQDEQHLKSYTNELLIALRMRDVPGPRIAEALAEVHSHVSETDEDPREAFGPPKEYAETLAAALDEDGMPTANLLRLIATYGLGGAAGAWLLLDGPFALVAGERGVLGLPPVVPVVLGLLVLAAMAVGMTRLSRGSEVEVLDPRTGADMAPPLPSWVRPVMLAPLVLAVALPVALAVAQR